MLKYRRVGITVKSDFDHRDEVLRDILALLQELGAEVKLDARRCKTLRSAKGYPLYKDEKNIDLLLVLGGDGTILRAVRELKDFSIPIVSVNRGTIGFLAEMTIEEVPEILPRLLRGQGIVEERNVLKITARRGKKTLFQGAVLNEAVISQGSIARLIDLQTFVNNEKLTIFRADGLIIATPTGSTAYSLAAGGPIVHPRLSAMILTPINSHSFAQKPVVIPGNQRIEVEVLTKEKKFADADVSLTLDGQTYVKLKRNDRIEAHMNDTSVKFLRRKEETFYQTLRTKLGWGE